MTFSILIFQHDTYWKKANNCPPSASACWSGLGMDAIELLATYLNFTYNFVEQSSDIRGIGQLVNDTYGTGLVGSLMRSEIDMIGAITVPHMEGTMESTRRVDTVYRVAIARRIETGASAWVGGIWQLATVQVWLAFLVAAGVFTLSLRAASWAFEGKAPLQLRSIGDHLMAAAGLSLGQTDGFGVAEFSWSSRLLSIVWVGGSRLFWVGIMLCVCEVPGQSITTRGLIRGGGRGAPPLFEVPRSLTMADS